MNAAQWGCRAPAHWAGHFRSSSVRQQAGSRVDRPNEGELRCLAQAIARESRIVCWKMQRRRVTFFTRPALAPWEPALTLHAILGAAFGRSTISGLPMRACSRRRATGTRHGPFWRTRCALRGICSDTFRADGHL
jgi:hypothetical protein